MSINYEYLVDSAMRVMIKSILQTIETEGALPDKHYFHISFMTKYEGVKAPDHILVKYPEEMTIALQHQFKNLYVYEDRFSVELSFGGKDERLIVPFCAITGFSDPSENFNLPIDVDYTGITKKSGFHSMIGSSTPAHETHEEKPVDNVISFAEVKRLFSK